MDKLSTYCFCVVMTYLALLGVANANHNYAGHNFTVIVTVYCDNCAAGFPTSISPPIPGAMVAVECKDHAGKRLFYNEGVTDDNGHASVVVKGEHESDCCEAYTISSPTSCNIPLDSNRSPVSLTQNNGIDSKERKIGPFAFRSTKIHPACQAIMAEYAAVDYRAGPPRVIIGGVGQTNRAKPVVLGQEEDIEGYDTNQSRRRNCCGDDYCTSCMSFEEEGVQAPVP